jgi:hypothetical protein
VRIACWSVKGGSGTTVVAAGLALLSARIGPVTLVDLGGELPAVLGLPEPSGPGVADWLRAGAHPPEALDRLRVAVCPGVELLPLGHGPLPGEPGVDEALAIELARREGTCVIDAGLQPGAGRVSLVEGADLSLLVLRPCYLAIRRLQAQPLRPDGVVVVREPGRALSATDVADILGVPVRAEVALDPTIARAVDAGLLSCRLPRVLERGLRSAA